MEPAQRSQQIVHRTEHPHEIARRNNSPVRASVHSAPAHVAPKVRGADQRPQLRTGRIATLSPRRIASAPSARSDSVAVKAERRARARQAAIIEPPLGFKTHVTLVELPAALRLDLGRDPVPALQLQLKHRH